MMVNGIAQKPIEGVSMAYTFDKANADAPSTRTTQYFEMFGNRAHLPRRLDRRDDAAGAAVAAGHGQAARRASTATSGSSTTSPRTTRRTTTSRRKMPDKLRELQELFLVEAAKYHVFPLDNSVLPRIIAPRPSATAGRTVFTYTGEMSGAARQRRARAS